MGTSALPPAVAQAAAEYGGVTGSQVLRALEDAVYGAVRFGGDNILFLAGGLVLLWLVWQLFFRSA